MGAIGQCDGLRDEGCGSGGSLYWRGSGNAMAPSSPPTRGFRSLTARLIVWTLLAVGGVYVATVAVSNALARRMAMAAAEREAVNETEAAVSRVEDLLHSIEERTLALGEALSVLGPRDADVDPLLRRFVQGNRDLYGAAIAWVPGPRGERRALYYHWAAEGESRLLAANLASESYRYWERAWFRARSRREGPSGRSRTGTRAEGTPRWSPSPSRSAGRAERRPGS